MDHTTCHPPTHPPPPRHASPTHPPETSRDQTNWSLLAPRSTARVNRPMPDFDPSPVMVLPAASELLAFRVAVKDCTRSRNEIEW